jgi:hypothetical protein
MRLWLTFSGFQARASDIPPKEVIGASSKVICCNISFMFLVIAIMFENRDSANKQMSRVNSIGIPHPYDNETLVSR